MRTVFYAICLLLLWSGYSRWQGLPQQIVELARQQLPQSIAGFLPNKQSSAYQLGTEPGLEKEIAERLKVTLQSLAESDSLNHARVSLKQVRFVPTTAATSAKASATTPVKARHTEEDEVAAPLTGFYVATLNYDLLSPLTVETGATLLTAACSCGVARVRLSDGYGVVKTFDCPVLKN
jgi:hypothetical protein